MPLRFPSRSGVIPITILLVWFPKLADKVPAGYDSTSMNPVTIFVYVLEEPLKLNITSIC